MATKIVHYASLTINDTETFGTAELLNGSGYLFRAEGERKAPLVDYRNVDLLLYGRCDLVAAADAHDGDRVRRCSQTLVEV